MRTRKRDPGARSRPGTVATAPSRRDRVAPDPRHAGDHAAVGTEPEVRPQLTRGGAPSVVGEEDIGRRVGPVEGHAVAHIDVASRQAVEQHDARAVRGARA